MIAKRTRKGAEGRATCSASTPASQPSAASSPGRPANACQAAPLVSHPRRAQKRRRGGHTAYKRDQDEHREKSGKHLHIRRALGRRHGVRRRREHRRSRHRVLKLSPQLPQPPRVQEERLRAAVGAHGRRPRHQPQHRRRVHVHEGGRPPLQQPLQLHGPASDLDPHSSSDPSLMPTNGAVRTHSL